MNKEDPFTAVALATRTHVEMASGRAVAARPSFDDPTRAEHLSWMLARAIGFHESGVVGLAHLWLGFVQGVLAMRGDFTLLDLDLVNSMMPSLGSYLPEASPTAGLAEHGPKP